MTRVSHSNTHNLQLDSSIHKLFVEPISQGIVPRVSLIFIHSCGHWLIDLTYSFFLNSLWDLWLQKSQSSFFVSFIKLSHSIPSYFYQALSLLIASNIQFFTFTFNLNHIQGWCLTFTTQVHTRFFLADTTVAQTIDSLLHEQKETTHNQVVITFTKTTGAILEENRAPPLNQIFYAKSDTESFTQFKLNTPYHNKLPLTSTVTMART